MVERITLTEHLRTLPGTLIAVIALLELEAVALVGVAVWSVIDTFTLPAQSLAWAVTMDVVLVAAAALCAWLGWLLLNLRAGARNPSVALHLLALPIGYYMVTGGLPVIGAILFALCVAGVVLLVWPSTTKALGIK
ncbi:hypothetical protein [Fodinicola acaciae]|uniref:hypothetical protein n=1 Tax=Fodinicola acaciae TaxID=2681555 RepID=UPI0013D01609|nr:hypothetical protein [Fodinicola acaciae]